MKTSPSYNYIVSTCIRKADHFLEQPPINVMDKKWSFNDDFHYYATMAGYWWPEKKKGKMVYVRHDGRSYPGSKDLDLGKISKMAERLQYFALSYYFSKNEKYLHGFENQIDVWFLNADTYMYPNSEYAQVIPGKKDIKGRGVGLIEAHPFNTILESIRLIESQISIGRERKDGLVKWFADFAIWMADSDLGIRDKSANSNQSVSYDITLANISEFNRKE